MANKFDLKTTKLHLVKKLNQTFHLKQIHSNLAHTLDRAECQN